MYKVTNTVVNVSLLEGFEVKACVVLVRYNSSITCIDALHHNSSL